MDRVNIEEQNKSICRKEEKKEMKARYKKKDLREAEILECIALDASSILKPQKVR